MWSKLFILLFNCVLIKGNSPELQAKGETNESGQCTLEEDCNGRNGVFLEKPTGTTPFINLDDVLVYTVATEETDGFQRYLSSAETYNIKPIVLGYGEKWKGGDDSKLHPGGGWKINLLRPAIEPFKNDPNKIILFTDAYDVIFLSNLNQIIQKFKATNSKILFGAEGSCWPNANLAEIYPKIENGKRYLNSGLFIGYGPELWKLLNSAHIEDTEDDQLFYTKAYLDENLRNKLQFKLDHKSEIFQNLYGALNEIELIEVKDQKEGAERYIIKNTITQTTPSIIHGNGLSKIHLNRLGNYLANSWNSKEGCITCKNGHIDLTGKKPQDMPLVVVALFIEYPTPFLEECLLKIAMQQYPKERIHLFIHNTAKYHIDHVDKFIEEYGTQYLSVKKIVPDDGTTEWNARDLSLDHCLAKNCEAYLSVDSIAHLDNPHTLRLLIEQNRTVVAPLLVRPGKSWSNFWGALTQDGFYARSSDYMEIVHNEKRGLWNVPYITNCYLINGTLLRRYDRTILNYKKDKLDADMAFCANLRDLDVFMYLSNRVDFGHLVNPEHYDVTIVEPDMYQIFLNPVDWEERYIHENYSESLDPEKKNHQPCPDVYWFPIVTTKFTKALINMMESFGQWSDGSNNDKRLEGGYEAVPTRDIHMNQVGWDAHWLEFLRKYVRPLQEHVFLGYIHDPPRSLMNFVVRYRPDEQPSLRPHHDSSTYTINIALNRVGIDYEGGGCRFLRYNCSVVDTRVGWMMMHPGRLTHYHEGLKVTKGTRYIMISFVDP